MRTGIAGINAVIFKQYRLVISAGSGCSGNCRTDSGSDLQCDGYGGYPRAAVVGDPVRDLPGDLVSVL